MKFCLEVMRHVVVKFDDIRSDDPELYRPDIFEEHYRCRAKVLYYSNCPKVAKTKRNFFLDEMIMAVIPSGEFPPMV